IGPRAVDVL
nr:Chain C, Pyruvate dehydrogenase phosphatase regulatory subunit, mitochondrial [Homo sapiens]8FHU_F Chain F, Pyruvate dehydrogenase phosphatase regulatory subunit, mitochondrial [Homo sapiens]